MSRLEGKCPGDCTKCQMLADGRVTMEICMMDQIFQRIQKMERNISIIQGMMEEQKKDIKSHSLVRDEDEQTEEAEQ